LICKQALNNVLHFSSINITNLAGLEWPLRRWETLAYWKLAPKV